MSNVIWAVVKSGARLIDLDAAITAHPIDSTSGEYAWDGRHTSLVCAGVQIWVFQSIESLYPHLPRAAYDAAREPRSAPVEAPLPSVADIQASSAAASAAAFEARAREAESLAYAQQAKSAMDAQIAAAVAAHAQHAAAAAAAGDTAAVSPAAVPRPQGKAGRTPARKISRR